MWSRLREWTPTVLFVLAVLGIASALIWVAWPGRFTSTGDERPGSTYNKVCDGPNLLYVFGNVSAVAVSPNDPQCAPGGTVGQK